MGPSIQMRHVCVPIALTFEPGGNAERRVECVVELIEQAADRGCRY